MEKLYHNSKNLSIKAKNGNTYVYRKFGQEEGIPVIIFNHLAATLENIDPRLVDPIAEKFPVIAFDNTGVGGSSGKVPTSISQMADDALNFIEALGIQKFHLFGFSMGAMVGQELLEKNPKIVEKVILAGTGPRGGKGIDKVTGVTFSDMIRSVFYRIDPKRFLFFYHDEDGKNEAIKFLKSINARKNDLDKNMSINGFLRQLYAIYKWGKEKPANLSFITHPTLIANGDNDRMVPTENSYDLHKRIAGSKLIIYPKSGHGGIFQNYKDFSQKVIQFLQK